MFACRHAGRPPQRRVIADDRRGSAKAWRGRRPGCESGVMARTVRVGATSSTLPLGTEAWAVATGRVLVTFPGGCVRFDYEEDALGRAELALPELLDAVRLVPRWRLNAYVLKLTEGRERHL
jgi:hypothetical protein